MALRITGKHIALGLVGLITLLGVAALWLLWAYLTPEPQAPDLATRAAPPPRPAPAAVVLADDDDDDSAEVSSLCPLEVLVLAEGGGPVAGAQVEAVARGEGFFRLGSDEASTGEDGRALLKALPCGVVRVSASAEGFAGAVREGVDAFTWPEIELRLVAGVELWGEINAVGGEPIEDARVQAAGQSARSEVDGSYRLRVDPHQLRKVRASAEGYEDAAERLRVDPAEPGPHRLDLELRAAREVTVYCAGLDGDSCEPVEPLMCTRPLRPIGESCSGDPTICACPEGVAAIRGGGQIVRVEPGDDVVWLDLRREGGLSGRVLLDDAPLVCDVTAFRMPRGIEDLAGGLVAGRAMETGEDGRFRFVGLKPGRWQIEVKHQGRSKTEPVVQVDDELVDVGDVRLEAGGTIRGVVLDGLTGEGVAGQQVVAAQQAQGDDIPPTGKGVSLAEGRFTIGGLADGSYQVLLALRPFERVEVAVVDGEGDREVELETGAASLLDEQGFGLKTDAAGDLLVRDLDPEGLAAGAGLQDGDFVEGVTLFGFDFDESLPGMSDAISDFLLENYSGPGMGLKVDRDGELLQVELE